MFNDDEFIAKYESNYLTSNESRQEIFSTTFEDGQELFELLDSITQNDHPPKLDKVKSLKGRKSTNLKRESETKSTRSEISENELNKTPKNPKTKSIESNDTSDFDTWLRSKGKVISQLNRLSEGNIRVIIDEISAIISSLNIKSGRLSVDILNDLSELIIQFSVSNDQLQPSVIVAYTGIVCWLTSLSHEIGYIFIGNIYKMIRDSVTYLSGTDKNKDDITSKKSIAKNCIVSLASLYHFEILDIEILCDVIHVITDCDINDELSYVIITMIRYCGQIIHFKSPQIIKQIILHIQNKIDEYKTICDDYSKSVVRFLELEINERKSSNNTLPIDNMKETLKRYFNITLFVSKENFYNFINSPYKNNPSKALNHVSNDYSHLPTSQSSETKQLLSKASSLGLSNSIQKSVFLTLMRSCDSLQAFKIITNNYPNKNNIPNIVKTVITCMFAEREFNPFYVQVIEHLNKFGNKAWNKSFKYTLRCTIHNHFINIDKLSKRKRSILQNVVDVMIDKKLIDEQISELDNDISVE